MKQDKNIDGFTKDILNEIGLEKPSKSFVENVMNSVDAPEIIKIQYTPLISKKVWFIIAACFIGIFTSVFILPTNNSLFEKIGVNLNTHITFNFLEGMPLSTPVIYALVAFGFLLLVQIYFLKNNFDKQISNMYNYAN